MQDLKVAKEPAKGGIQVTLLELMAAEELHGIRLGASALRIIIPSASPIPNLALSWRPWGLILIVIPFASLAVRLLFSFAD
jgi:hypothetical protein